MDSNERKKQIRAVAAALISNDQEIARPKASSTDMTEKNRLFGRNMLYLSVLTAILGLYLQRLLVANYVHFLLADARRYRLMAIGKPNKETIQGTIPLLEHRAL